jgi:hypothetical protein
MEEYSEGDGELERWENPDKKYPVRYQFTITTEIITKTGIHAVGTKRHGVGRVTSLSGAVFAEGEYRLIAEDSEVLKVFNSGLDHWEILSS